jgi:hypothetical protein
MPLKKKPLKKPLKSAGRKKVIAKSKSHTEKKKTLKPKASGGNIFWKVLEMRKQERQARHQGEQGNHDAKDPRHVYNDKHSKFARFAGPRRRAA